jgi:hypothetical protein
MISTNLYIKTILSQKFPSLDVSDGSPLAELFLNPTSAVLDPLLTQVKYLLDNLGLQDPENIDPIELDQIAGNFLVYRRQATFSTGYVELFYDTIQAVTIPANTVFVSTDGRQYINSAGIQLSAAMLQGNIWRYPLYSTGLIPIVAISDTLGTMLSPGMITSTTLVPAPTLVTNPTTFAPGILAETNTELVARLIDAVLNRSLASDDGFKVLIAENFPTVQKTRVISAGDVRMVRDTYYEGTTALQNYHVSDYLGKVNTSDFKDGVPDTDQTPYCQSKAFWQIFIDDPADTLINNIPSPSDTYWREFTTTQYSTLYYKDDVLGTDLKSTLLLDDTLRSGKIDPRWMLGDAHYGTALTQDANEITALEDLSGVRFGQTPEPIGPDTPISVTQSFLTVIQENLEASASGNNNVAQDQILADQINTLITTPISQNYFPIMHTPIEYQNGITITGKFTTTDTSNTQLSYVTVLRNPDTLAPFDGIGFAWKTGPSTAYNIYLVDADQLDETIFLTSGELFQSLGANQFKQTVLGEILTDTQYSFKLDIASDYAMTLNIWPTANGDLNQYTLGVITVTCSAFTPASLTNLHVDPTTAHFGIAIAGTQGATWTYSDLQISSAVAMHIVALCQIKADSSEFPLSSNATINCYGYGVSNTITSGLNVYIWNSSLGVTGKWELIGSNTALNTDSIDQRLISYPFKIVSKYRDASNYINIALTTPSLINTGVNEVFINYVDLENTKPEGVSIGGKSDIYITDPKDILIGEQITSTSDSKILITPANGFVLPLLNVAKVVVEVSGEELTEGVDWILCTDNIGNAYSTREIPYISILNDYNNLDLHIYYRYNQNGVALQTMFDDPSKRFVGTDSLAKLAPPTIIKIKSLSYSGTLTVTQAQELITNYVLTTPIINVSEIIALLTANGAYFVDISTISVQAVCYDETRNILSQTDVLTTYTCPYDLGMFYTDAYALSGITKL